MVNSLASFSWSSCLAVAWPLNKVDEGLIGGLYLVEAPGKAELARDALLAEDPLIDVGPLLFPWKTEDGDILDWALPLVLPVTVDGLELTALVEPLLPENLLVPD